MPINIEIRLNHWLDINTGLKYKQAWLYHCDFQKKMVGVHGTGNFQGQYTHHPVYRHPVYRHHVIGTRAKEQTYIAKALCVLARNTKGGKYHCTIDLLFDRFGISCMKFFV
jgi:hypothetical protein